MCVGGWSYGLRKFEFCLICIFPRISTISLHRKQSHHCCVAHFNSGSPECGAGFSHLQMLPGIEPGTFYIQSMCSVTELWSLCIALNRIFLEFFCILYIFNLYCQCPWLCALGKVRINTNWMSCNVCMFLGLVPIECCVLCLDPLIPQVYNSPTHSLQYGERILSVAGKSASKIALKC